MSDVIQGQQTSFFKNFLDDNSSPIPSGISGTTIDIYHFNNSILVQDVISDDMTQQIYPFENIWNYNYVVPQDADLTTYNVVYNALFSGNVIQSSETFNVLPTNTEFESTFGQGSVLASGTVVGPSGESLSGVGISVSINNTIYAEVSTNVSGNYFTFLDPNDYVFTFVKSGYFTNQELETIPTMVTSTNLGTHIIYPSSGGILEITDTFVIKTPSQQLIPIPNLKVSLYSISSIAGTQPLAETFTDENGVWILSTNQGKYVLTVQGQLFNNSTKKNDRFNYTYDIEVNQAWSGTNNFQYLDTSTTGY